MHRRATQIIILLCIIGCGFVGFALANIESLLDSRYGGPMKDIAIVQENLNDLRGKIAGASAAEIIANAKDIEKPLANLAGEIRLAKAAFGELNEPHILEMSVLNEDQFDELRATISIYDAELAKELSDKRAASDLRIISVLSVCADKIAVAGDVFANELRQETPSSREVHIARSNLSLEMARFDILVAYFTLLNEKARS